MIFSKSKNINICVIFEFILRLIPANLIFRPTFTKKSEIVCPTSNSQCQISCETKFSPISILALWQIEHLIVFSAAATKLIATKKLTQNLSFQKVKKKIIITAVKLLVIFIKILLLLTTKFIETQIGLNKSQAQTSTNFGKFVLTDNFICASTTGRNSSETPISKTIFSDKLTSERRTPSGYSRSDQQEFPTEFLSISKFCHEEIVNCTIKDPVQQSIALIFMHATLLVAIGLSIFEAAREFQNFIILAQRYIDFKKFRATRK